MKEGLADRDTRKMDGQIETQERRTETHAQKLHYDS